jgi:pimeloyl-ACP methyl ester carboxylesterase
MEPTTRDSDGPPSISRRALIGAGAVSVAAAVAGCSDSSRVVAAQRSPRVRREGVRNVVLVHGAYADGSCWMDVIGRLQAAGLMATAVQNPLTSLADDAAATRRALDIQTGPAILVGHSFAGTVVTEAGDHPRAANLVYVAARAPDVGENYTALAKRFPTPPASAGLVYRAGFGQLTEESFLKDFANGVDPARARVLYSVQGPVSAKLFNERTTVAAWRSKPTRYAISRHDRTTSPKLERFLSDRMRAKTIELDSGHLSMVTHAPEITRLILDAASQRNP